MENWRVKELKKALRERVLVMASANGTSLQRRFPCELANVESPDRVAAMHKDFIDAGADIICTNTFNANAAALAGVAIPCDIIELNRRAATIARGEALTELNRSHRMVWVAGNVGPTACDVLAFRIQIKTLVDSDVDLILIETVFDLRNLAAALLGAKQAFDDMGISRPVMVSATIDNRTGLLPSKESLADFISLARNLPQVVSVGLNCCGGPEGLLPHIDVLSQQCPELAVTCHPSAGLPGIDGSYPYSPETFVGAVEPMLSTGLLNVVGGCCGTTPAHVARLAEAASAAKPRLFQPQSLEG